MGTTLEPSKTLHWIWAYRTACKTHRGLAQALPIPHSGKGLGAGHDEVVRKGRC